MGDVKDREVKVPHVMQDIFNDMFPLLKTPKNDTREEDKQEGRQKEKKGRDDEE